MRVVCGFDHAGAPLRDAVVAALEGDGHAVVDAGTYDDYPYAAAAVARALADGAERAVLVCGSGAGVSVAATKLPGVRAATVHDTYTAHQGVEHDDLNVLCLGARVIGPELAVELVRTFAAATFSGAERHRRRLDEVAALERDGLDGLPPEPTSEPPRASTTEETRP
ncbi:MAG TPA: RpiB/LacA/LacB family sugar-phosphate isomerase [Conexibacter sp.]|nr:RpiB/LacA/LacB family sugar-phosphate isomerase [Conexibacter sp.]